MEDYSPPIYMKMIVALVIPVIFLFHFNFNFKLVQEMYTFATEGGIFYAVYLHLMMILIWIAIFSFRIRTDDKGIRMTWFLKFGQQFLYSEITHIEGLLDEQAEKLRIHYVRNGQTKTFVFVAYSFLGEEDRKSLCVELHDRLKEMRPGALKDKLSKV